MFKNLTKQITNCFMAVMLLAGAAVTLPSCEALDDAEYPKILELIAPTSEFNVDEAEGAVEIPIYAKGGYSVKFMNNIEGNWATLNHNHMNNDGTLVVSYKQNDGFRRMAAIRLCLDSGERADTVWVKQAGVVPVIDCGAPFKAIEGSSVEPIQLDVDTNIPFDEFEIAYTNDGANWISDISIEEGVLTMTPAANNSELPRNSIVSFTYIDGWGEKFELRVFITQANCNDEFGAAATFEGVREMATEDGFEVTDDINLTGWVVSDFRSKNMAFNPNTNYDKVDTSVSARTAYLESEDGAYGIRLVFDNVEDNELRRYSKMQIGLKGTKIVKELNPDRYAIVGLKAENLLSGEAGTAADLPAKRKSIGELTDNDIYTFVTLPNTEFVFKDGAYVNYYEGYALRSSVNHFSDDANDPPNNRMDCWASVLYDGNGDAIYMSLNSLVEWRRKGNGVPQGAGDMSGVIVHEQNPRYGDYMGRYQIRPVEEADVLSIGDTGAKYKTFAEWNGKYSYKFSLYTAAIFGKAYGSNGVDSIIPPDLFETQLTAELRCENKNSSSSYPLQAGAHYNALDPGNTIDSDGNPIPAAQQDTKKNGQTWSVLGNRASKAFYLDQHDVKGWYKWADNAETGKKEVIGYNGVCLDIVTRGISGSKFCLAFNFMAGTGSAANSKAYPAHWCVEYTIDGGATWTPVGDKIVSDAYSNQPFVKLRAHPWWDATVTANKYYTPAACGMGCTDHIFFFPSDIFGKDRVTIRIRPYDDVLASLPLQWNGSVEGGVVRANTTQKNYIRFGNISLRYM